MPEPSEQQSRDLPWPDEWAEPGGVRQGLVAVVFLLLGFGSAVGAATALSSTPPDGRGVIMGICAPLFFGFASIVNITRFRVRARGTTSVRSGRVDAADSTGVIIPYSRSLAGTYVAMTIAMLMLFGLIATMSLLFVVSEDTSDTSVFIQAAVTTAGVVYLLWMVSEMVRGKLALGALALAPAGIYHRSWSFTSFFPWENVVSVSCDADGQLITAAVYENSTPHFDRQSRLWRQPELTLAPHMGIKGMNLSVDPALAFHAMRYYQEHPELRAELAAPEGVERVRTANLLDQ